MEGAASKMARVKNEKKNLYLSIGIGVVFLIVIWGLMIGSVVLAIKITKQVKVRNGIMVDNDGNIVSTQTKIYNNEKLSPDTPYEYLQDLKYVNVNKYLFFHQIFIFLKIKRLN